MIVSHDSGFLDNVCTHIIHYENRKLRRYKGNLSEFVKQVRFFFNLSFSLSPFFASSFCFFSLLFPHFFSLTRFFQKHLKKTT